MKEDQIWKSLNNILNPIFSNVPIEQIVLNGTPSSGQKTH